MAERSHPEGARSYPALYGRTLAVDLVTSAVAAGLGGFLVPFGWFWPYALSLVPALLP